METPSDNPTRTVLVTGASGFIGAHLCRRLRKLGHRVTGVSRRHPENLPDGVEPCRADLASPGETAALLARVKLLKSLRRTSSLIYSRHLFTQTGFVVCHSPPKSMCLPGTNPKGA